MKKLLLIGLIFAIVSSVKGITQEYNIRLVYNAIFQDQAIQGASLEQKTMLLAILFENLHLFDLDGKASKEIIENIKKTIFHYKVVTGISLTCLIASVYAIYQISKKVTYPTKKMYGYLLTGGAATLSVIAMILGLYNINLLNKFLP